MEQGQIVAWKISPVDKLEVVRLISDTELEVKKIGDDSGVTRVFHPDSFEVVEE